MYFEFIELLQFFDNKLIMNFEKVKNTKGCFKFIIVFLKYIFSLINFEYLMDFNNMAETAMFILNCYYNHLRIQYPQNYLAKLEHLEERGDLK